MGIASGCLIARVRETGVTIALHGVGCHLAEVGIGKHGHDFIGCHRHLCRHDVGLSIGKAEAGSPEDRQQHDEEIGDGRAIISLGWPQTAAFASSKPVSIRCCNIKAGRGSAW